MSSFDLFTENKYNLSKNFFPPREEGGATEHTDVAADVHELYVELMCKVDKDKVAGYVIRTDGYRLEETLEVIIIIIIIINLFYKA